MFLTVPESIMNNILDLYPVTYSIISSAFPVREVFVFKQRAALREGPRLFEYY
jgi:hypothetical protein